MHLVIIGEAAARLPDEVTEAAPEVPWSQIRGLRNFIAHGYFALDLSMVWQTVSADLAPLARAIEDLDGRLGPDLD